MLKTLECYLQITNQSISSLDKLPKNFQTIIDGFIGASFSAEFQCCSYTSRRLRTNIFIEIIRGLKSKKQIKVPASFGIYPSKAQEKYISVFRNLEKSEERIYLWSAWPVRNSLGNEYWLPLLGFYCRIGRTYTEKLHEALATYSQARRAKEIKGLRELSDYIKDLPFSITEASLKDEIFMSRLWPEFVRHYVTTKYKDGNGSQISTLVINWNRHLSNLINNHIAPANLISTGYSGIPILPKKLSKQEKGKIRVSAKGQEISTKLIIDVPLSLTDSEAIYSILDQLTSISENICSWAKHEVNSLYGRYKRRVESASNGETRRVGEGEIGVVGKWLRDPQNPNYQANAAATIERHDYEYVRKYCTQLLPLPLPATAYALGLPITGALYPHCIILIKNSPQITPSFLQNLEIFEKSGKRVGLIVGTEASYLVGYKYRRGASNAQQKIKIPQESVEIVNQIIEITDYARRHLRKTNNENWRYLLLTCQKGFSSIRRITKLSDETTTETGIKRISEGLAKHSNLSITAAKDLARKMNLSTLRSSFAVLIYLKTKSLAELAKALGHKTKDTALLEHYLPRPILDFFQERWIRIFQAGIILEAMSESDLIVKASDFSDLIEVEQFLLNHSILIPKDRVNANSDPGRSQIIFGVNEQILRVMMRVRDGEFVSNCAFHTEIWKDLSRHLISHIEKELIYRPDIQRMLEKARENY
ncbi:hypothetical protein KUT98_23060 [Pseudomonas aeruginosa]|nr:hypothetical protein [Pseudomonas aeruginosa]